MSDIRLDVDIAEAGKGDVTDLCNLLLRYFGYIYEFLFGTSNELASSLLKHILSAHEGKHSLGYKSFYVARHRSTKEICGMLLLKRGNSKQKYDQFITTLAIMRIVLVKLGLRGLFRTSRNWQVISAVSVKVKPDELHIVYLAVSEATLHRQVGKQLLDYARGVAKAEGKKLISLIVRQQNLAGHQFFLSQGFSVENVVVDAEADSLLGLGPSVQMVAKV